MLAAWLLYPCALGVVCLGLGLLADRLTGGVLPRVLLLGTGLAALVALARLVTATEATAPLALPAVLLLAAAGFATSWRRLRGRPDPLVLLGWLGVCAVFAAPVVLSGEPTFAGYTLLPDTSHQLALASLYADHGPAYEQLPDSSYRLALAKYVISAYPVAGQAALGITAPLGGLDIAWLYQPFLTVVASTVFLALVALVRPLLRERRLVAGVAFVAAQPALVVSYALQGSIKELTATAMLVLSVAILTVAAGHRRPARPLVLVALAGAAAFGALGPAVALYLVVLAAIAVALVLRTRPRRLGDLAWIGVGALTMIVLSLPMLAKLRTAYDINTATLDNAEDLGNLARPLRPIQAFGVWLNGDFRYDPGQPQKYATFAIVAGMAILAVVGVAWLVRRRREAVGPLLLIGLLTIPSLYLLRRGSPYADGKVLMLLSPAPLLATLAGAVALIRTRRSPVVLAGVAAIAVVGTSVLASNALAYRDASLAPYDRYGELLEINARLDGRGPAISTEYDEFGAYFLRDAEGRSQPEYPHGYREAPYEPSALGDPRRRPSIKTPLDPDDLTLRYVQSAPYMVVRRSPTASRPPSNFELDFRGRWYEVWTRRPAPRVLAHVPLGLNVFEPSDEPSCTVLGRLGGRARRAGGRLAYVVRTRSPTLVTAEVGHSRLWFPYGGFPGALVPALAGRATGGLAVPSTGDYRIWVEGSFGREIRVLVDGREVGAVAGRLNNPGNWERLGAVHLRRGTHRIDLIQAGGSLAPGDAGFRASLRHLGPVQLSSIDNERRRVERLPGRGWRSLCGRRLDWVEVVGP